MHKIFVSDYDGTITGKDFFLLLAERYLPADTPDYFARYREGRISHFEAMAAYFAFAPTNEQQLEELLTASQPDPDLGASAALLRRAGWKLWVVSAGSSWYVERVLSRALAQPNLQPHVLVWICDTLSTRPRFCGAWLQRVER